MITNNQKTELTPLQTSHFNRLKSYKDGENTPAFLKKHGPVIGNKILSGSINPKLAELIADATTQDKYRQSDEFQQFIAIIANLDLTDLPVNGKGLFELMRLLLGKKPGNEGQQAYIKELLLELSKKTPGYKLKPAWLEKTFDDLRQLAEEPQESPRSIGDEISGQIATAGPRLDTKNRAKEASETNQESVYAPFRLPEELQERLAQLQKEEMLLQKKYNENHAAGRMKECNKIETEIDKLRESLYPLEQQESNLLERGLRQKQAIDKASKELGINLTSRQPIVSDLGIYTIDKIEFDTETQLALEEYGPGALIFHYKFEGKPMKPALYANFRHEMRGYLAHQPISTIAELNTTIEDNTHFANLAVGQIYISKLTGQAFTITNIDQDRGLITTNPPIRILNSKTLSLTTPISRRKDVIKKTLSFGLFATALISNDYHRIVKPDEVNGILAKNFEKTKAKVRGFTPEENPDIFNAVNNLDGEKPPILPDTINATKTILLRQDNKALYKGQITLNKDGSYTFSPEQIFPSDLANVPERFRALTWGNRYKKKHPKKKQKHKGPWLHEYFPEQPMTFQTSDIIDRAKRGDIYNLPDQPKVLLPANDDVEITLDKAKQTSAALELADGLKDQIDLPDEEPPKDKKKTEEEEKAKKLPNPEALAFDKVCRYGPMPIEEEGYFKSMWSATRFFSVGDLFEMGKTMWEYYDRRFTTRQKQKYASTGKNLKYFGPEMQRINQHAENEEVGQFKETLDQFGVLQTQDRLRNTRNFFEFKACFQSLVGKGQMRWDDVSVWKAINRFAPKDKQIPIPFDGKPHTVVAREGKRDLTGMDFLKPPLDGFWGEGTYDDWMSSNKGTFQSGTQKFAEEGKALESTPGGYGARLANLLAAHKRGEFVDPQRYEGLILASIDNGKGSMQDKVYYMLEGVAAVNKDGRTIMDFDRIAHINATYLTRFPFLDYICASVPRPPDGKSYRFSLEDYKSWVKLFDGNHPENVRPTDAVNDFLWRHALTANQTVTRINKVRDYQGFDPDDTFAFFPPMTVQIITDACNVGSVGGGKKATSVEAFKNIFPGYNQYLKTLAHKGDISKLRAGINSFIRFESIMTNRYEKDNNIYQRLEDDHLRGTAVMGATSVQQYINEVNTMIDKITAAYVSHNISGAQEFKDKLDIARIIVTDEEFITPEGRAKQEKVNAALKSLPRLFDIMVGQDNGQIMTAVASSESSTFTGIPYIASDEFDERKEAAEKAAA